MSENKIQLNDVTKLEGLNDLDFSNSFVCDMETGICGPANESQKETIKDEEKKNANHNMV